LSALSDGDSDESDMTSARTRRDRQD